MYSTFRYATEDIAASSWVNLYTENFRPGAGFLSPRRYGTLYMGTQQYNTLWRNVGPWEDVTIYGGLSGGGDLDFDPQEKDFWFGANANWLNRTFTDINMRMENNTHSWIDDGEIKSRVFSTSELYINTSRYWSSAFDGYVNLAVGNEPYYGDDSYDPGFVCWVPSVLIGCNGRPFDRLSYGAYINTADYRTRWQGDRKWAHVTLWGKVTVLLARGLYLRTIMQAQRIWMEYPRYQGIPGSESTVADTNVLLTWEYLPLSNLYVGCNLLDYNRWDNMYDNLQLFAKINYLWSM